MTQTTGPNATDKKPDPRLSNYIRIFLVPTLINKGLILYFGLNYSMYPDEGYGYGLAISVSLTLLSFAYFLYINWDSAE
jgi:hypothetical protein